MSLMNTKPRYFPTAIATESGWINPVTKELLVSVGGLKSKLALEESKERQVLIVDAEVIPVIEEVKLVETIKEEIVMNEKDTEVKTRKPYAPRKPKVIGEVTESNLQTGQQLIGEVVEYNLETPIIAE